MKISRDGILSADPGDPALSHVMSKRCGGLLTPKGVVWHWTASGADDRRGHTDSLALARWIADPKSDAAASWHAVIDRDGAVIQSVPFGVEAWHVKGLSEGVTVNSQFLGVELENLGELRPDAERFAAWPWESRSPHVGTDVATRYVIGSWARWFHTYTAAQEASAEALIRACVARYGWGRRAFEWGHGDFPSAAATKPPKIDPGPLWQRVVLPRILDRVFPAKGAA